MQVRQKCEVRQYVFQRVVEFHQHDGVDVHAMTEAEAPDARADETLVEIRGGSHDVIVEVPDPPKPPEESFEEALALSKATLASREEQRAAFEEQVANLEQEKVDHILTFFATERTPQDISRLMGLPLEVVVGVLKSEARKQHAEEAKRQAKK